MFAKKKQTEISTEKAFEKSVKSTYAHTYPLYPHYFFRKLDWWANICSQMFVLGKTLKFQNMKYIWQRQTSCIKTGTRHLENMAACVILNVRLLP